MLSSGLCRLCHIFVIVFKGSFSIWLNDVVNVGGRFVGIALEHPW